MSHGMAIIGEHGMPLVGKHSMALDFQHRFVFIGCGRWGESDAYAYDVDESTWKYVTWFPYKKYEFYDGVGRNPCLGQLGRRLVVARGGTEKAQLQCMSFDLTGTWGVSASKYEDDYPGKRGAHSAYDVVNGELYTWGNNYSNADHLFDNTLWKFSLTNGWTNLGTVGHTNWLGVMSHKDNIIYLGVAYTEPDLGFDYEWFSYNIDTATFTSLADFPENDGNRRCASFEWGGDIYVGWGYQGGSLSQKLRKYSILTNSWSTVESSTPYGTINEAEAKVFGDWVYVKGRISGNGDFFARRNMATDTWEQLDDYPGDGYAETSMGK